MECDVDLDTDPLRSSFKVRVQGHKREFTIQANTEQKNEYALDMSVKVVYQNKNWTGQGKVYGWLHKKLGKNSSATVTVRETIDF